MPVAVSPVNIPADSTANINMYFVFNICCSQVILNKV
jgi:hypothetical protein